MSNKKKIKVFDDFTDAHVFGYWNFFKYNKQYRVKKVTSPRKGWVVFHGNGLTAFE
jgi:hypothetical protein